MLRSPGPSSGSGGAGASSSSKSRHGVRVAQTSADARLHAAYEGGSNRYPKAAGMAALAGAEEDEQLELPSEAVTAYLRSMQRGGVTQSFGCMLAVEEETFRVMAYSENAAEVLGLKGGKNVQEVGIGTDARELLAESSVTALEEAAEAEDPGILNPVAVNSKSGVPLYAMLRANDEIGGLVVDLEPAEATDMFVSEGAAGAAIARVQALPVRGDLRTLLDLVVEEVRDLTGYDRVMAYKFHEDEHGEVVAERLRADLEPYIGLHYPATDVPQASRFLFMKERVRMIADCFSTPVHVVQSRELHQPISLAGSSLRSPHACHAQYMANMGSVASLALAVVTRDAEEELSGSRRLWGLVVCHHTTPRTLPFPLRKACESLVQAFAAQLNREMEYAEQVRQERVQRNEGLLCDMLLRELPVGVVVQAPTVMDLVDCSGAALYYGKRIWMLGTTPTEAQIREMASWLLREDKDVVDFASDSLTESGYPGAAALGDAVAGMAAARISPAGSFVFWFRSQEPRERTWAGAQHSAEEGDDGNRLHPRSSFLAFAEYIKGRSSPWEAVDRDAIHSLHLILQREEEAIQESGSGSSGVKTTSTSMSVTGRGMSLSLPVPGGPGGGDGGNGPSLSMPCSLAREWIEAMRSSEGSDGVSGMSRDVKDALGSFPHAFVVCDAGKPDYPIIFASAGFFGMTGYGTKEVLGANPRFLQGPDTDSGQVEEIRAAFGDGGSGSFCGRILNYKKDGTTFWNLLTITAVKDDAGRTTHFVGMQAEVSKHTEGAMAEVLRPKGLPQSLIKYDARQQEKAMGLVGDLVAAVARPRQVLEQPPPLLDPRFVSMSTLSLVSEPRTKVVAGWSSGSNSSGGLASGSAISEQERKPLLLEDVAAAAAAAAQEAGYPDLEVVMVEDDGRIERARLLERTRRGVDLATTLERIDDSFVITDPRLDDNPIIFASDRFLDLTEYTREEVLGRNCRFLQGPDTDPFSVKKIRDAVRDARDLSLEIVNYTKGGQAFWNLFHLQAMRDPERGALQYFIGVQQKVADYVPAKDRDSAAKAKKRIPTPAAMDAERDREGEVQQAGPGGEGEEAAQQVLVNSNRTTAKTVDRATRQLPDADQTPDALWVAHSVPVTARPHKLNSAQWHAIRRVQRRGQGLGLGLKDFRPLRPLGRGDTGSVYLVELRGTGHVFAMKAMDKSAMVRRNKVHRACAERSILAMVDHPFLPTLYASFQTRTHVCLITDFCPGGELFLLQEEQPRKIFSEDAARFYAAEVVIALEYLHYMGVIYRDLKPENVLLQDNGHILLTDFDLSFLTSSRPQLLQSHVGPMRRRKRRREQQPPVFCAQPSAASNSFVGTEEYIAPEVINGEGHTSAVDWWALGILLYEMLYGRTPFRGRNRHLTFVNVLQQELTFPASIPVSLPARQLIRGLLHRDPVRRLGAFRGANDIKQHPFFHGFNWPLIRCRNPPSLEAPITFHQDARAHADNGAHGDDTFDLGWDKVAEGSQTPPPASAAQTFSDVF